jgi:hypothetical protein
MHPSALGQHQICRFGLHSADPMLFSPGMETVAAFDPQCLNILLDVNLSSCVAYSLKLLQSAEQSDGAKRCYHVLSIVIAMKCIRATDKVTTAFKTYSQLSKHSEHIAVCAHEVFMFMPVVAVKQFKKCDALAASRCVPVRVYGCPTHTPSDILAIPTS